MAIDMKILQSKDPFADLPGEYLAKISDSATITEYRKGEQIFRVGDDDEREAYLVWGEVRLTAEDQRVSSLRHDHDRSRFALAKLKPRRFAAQAARSGTAILWVDSQTLDECVAGFRDSLLEDEDTILIS